MQTFRSWTKLVAVGARVVGVAVVSLVEMAPNAKPALGVLAFTSVAKQHWSLVFDDEFAGTTLNQSKWRSGRFGATSGADAPFNPRLEGAYFTSSGVQVASTHQRSIPCFPAPSAYTVASSFWSWQRQQSFWAFQHWLPLSLQARQQLPTG